MKTLYVPEDEIYESVDDAMYVHPNDAVSLLVPRIDADRLAAALKIALKSFVPHPINHPSMFKAKANGISVLLDLGFETSDL